MPGEFVSLEKTLTGVQNIIEGQCDDWPEQAFYMTGTIEQVEARVKELKNE